MPKGTERWWAHYRVAALFALCRVTRASAPEIALALEAYYDTDPALAMSALEFIVTKGYAVKDDAGYWYRATEAGHKWLDNTEEMLKGLT